MADCSELDYYDICSGNNETKNNIIMVNKMKRIGLLIVMLIPMFCSCKQNGAMPQTSGYKTMIVKTGTQTLQTSSSATIRGKQDVDIYPQISGKITKVCVEEGQRVHKNEVLFTIDRISYEAEYRTAEANRKAAEVSVKSAQMTYDSKKTLYDNKVISEYELNTAENSLLSAKATLAQAEAQKASAGNNLSYTYIKSPCDGVVGSLPFRTGALVSPSMSQAITTVSDNSQMYVYFSITENTLLDFTRKYGSIEKAISQLPSVKLELSDGTEYTEEGRIESISGIINPSTGTAQARAVFPNQNHTLLSGESGSVIIPQTYENVIIIPQEATFELQDKILVYKIIDGVTKSAVIKIAQISDGKNYIVTSGLKVGDEIIADGAGLLQDGINIKGGNSGMSPAMMKK
jgi:membrane fusion protein (multidrug efflux system)